MSSCRGVVLMSCCTFGCVCDHKRLRRQATRKNEAAASSAHGGGDAGNGPYGKNSNKTGKGGGKGGKKGKGKLAGKQGERKYCFWYIKHGSCWDDCKWVHPKKGEITKELFEKLKNGPGGAALQDCKFEDLRCNAVDEEGRKQEKAE